MSKTNRAYWLERAADDALYARLLAADEVLAGMEEGYRDARRELLRSVERFYARVMTEEGFSHAAAEENIRQGADALDELRAMQAYYEAQGSTESVFFHRYKAIARAHHMSRYDLLMLQVDQALDKLARMQETKTTEHLSDVCLSSYLDAVYAAYRLRYPDAARLMAEDGGVGISPSTMARIVRMNWSGANYSDAIWHREFDLSEKVRRNVIQHMIVGKTIADCEKELTQHLDRDHHFAAARLLRTETTHAHVQVRKEAFKDMDVERYRFVAKLDARTTQVCGHLHGEVFALKDATPGENMPPMHPNCRSDIQAEYERPFITDKSYRMRTEDGKYITIPFEESRQEWERRYGRKQVTIPIEVRPGQNYKPVRYEKEATEVRRKGTAIQTRRLLGRNNEIYVSTSVHLKPKMAHFVDKQITESLKLLGDITGMTKPRFVIVSESEMGSAALASFNIVSNTIYLKEQAAIKEALLDLQESLACPEDVKATYLHELLHWYDAQIYIRRFGKVTNADALSKYMRYIDEQAKVKLDTAGINEDNVFEELGRYAKECYFEKSEHDKPKYNETLTEKRVKELLK